MKYLLLTLCLALGYLAIPGRATAQTVSVKSSLVEKFLVSPGGRYTGSLTLSNTSDQQASVVIYLNDYYRPTPGAIEFTEPNTRPHDRSNLSWITLSEPVVELRPHESRVVDFTIQVPASDRLVHQNGTYWSSLLVESLESQRRRSGPQVTDRSRPFTMTMASSFRTSVLLTTTLPSTGEPRITFVDVSSTPERDGNTLFVDLRNDGPAAIGKSKMWVELYDRDGRKKADLNLEDIQVMLPGNSYRRMVMLPFDQYPAGMYRCVVVLDAGGEATFGTQAPVTLGSRHYR